MRRPNQRQQNRLSQFRILLLRCLRLQIQDRRLAAAEGQRNFQSGRATIFTFGERRGVQRMCHLEDFGGGKSAVVPRLLPRADECCPRVNVKLYCDHEWLVANQLRNVRDELSACSIPTYKEALDLGGARPVLQRHRSFIHNRTALSADNEESNLGPAAEPVLEQVPSQGVIRG